MRKWMLPLPIFAGLALAGNGDPLDRSEALQRKAELLLRTSDSARGGSLPGVRLDGEVVSYENGKREKEYKMTIQADSLNSLVTFTHPPRSNGIKMLMLRRNMWFISPDVHKPVPISPRQRLLGEATNGDIAGANFSRDYTANLVGRDTVGGDSCYVLALKARTKDVTYDSITYYISRATKLGMKAEFYTISGKLMKTALYNYGQPQSVEGRSVRYLSRTLIKSKMAADASTEITYSKVSFGKVPASKFDLSTQTR